MKRVQSDLITPPALHFLDHLVPAARFLTLTSQQHRMSTDTALGSLGRASTLINNLESLVCLGQPQTASSVQTKEFDIENLLCSLKNDLPMTKAYDIENMTCPLKHEPMSAKAFDIENLLSSLKNDPTLGKAVSIENENMTFPLKNDVVSPKSFDIDTLLRSLKNELSSVPDEASSPINVASSPTAEISSPSPTAEFSSPSPTAEISSPSPSPTAEISSPAVKLLSSPDLKVAVDHYTISLASVGGTPSARSGLSDSPKSPAISIPFTLEEIPSLSSRVTEHKKMPAGSRARLLDLSALRGRHDVPEGMDWEGDPPEGLEPREMGQEGVKPLEFIDVLGWFALEYIVKSEVTKDRRTRLLLLLGEYYT